MRIAKTGGTREQDAVAAWFQYAETLRPRFAELHVPAPSLVAGFDAMVAAVAQFGECELNARTLERATVLKVFPERRRPLKLRVTELNIGGIESLMHAETACKRLNQEIAKLKIDR